MQKDVHHSESSWLKSEPPGRGKWADCMLLSILSRFSEPPAQNIPEEPLIHLHVYREPEASAFPHSLLLLPNMLLEQKSLFCRKQDGLWNLFPPSCQFFFFVIYMVPVVLNIHSITWSVHDHKSFRSPEHPVFICRANNKSNTESIHRCSLLGKYLKRWLNRNISQSWSGMRWFPSNDPSWTFVWLIAWWHRHGSWPLAPCPGNVLRNPFNPGADTTA